MSFFANLTIGNAGQITDPADNLCDAKDDSSQYLERCSRRQRLRLVNNVVSSTKQSGLPNGSFM